MLTMAKNDKNAEPKPDRHTTTQFTLRLPDELRDELELMAKENYRTLTAEMIAAFRDHISRHKPKDSP